MTSNALVEEIKREGLKILEGDVLEMLRLLPDGCIQTIVTSPPYWGLRDYGIPPSIWGGNPECTHVWRTILKPRTSGVQNEKRRAPNAATKKPQESAFCKVCGAWKGCLGLEPDPFLFIQNMVVVFRELRRVLKKDGTLWMNLGDCYAGSGRGPTGQNSMKPAGTQQRRQGFEGRINRVKTSDKSWTTVPMGFKSKDLLGMPWRIAFALQEDGWWLRKDIIWSKTNPMPESVYDRPTTSHEYLFLMAKSRKYFYNNEAIREKAVDPNRERNDRVGGKNGHEVRHSEGGMMGASEYRNKRSVWELNTQSCEDAHFATFPEKLVEPCILAGSKSDDIVLDPFGGSGTTGRVALGLGRNAVMIEINPKYVDIMKRRCQVTRGFKF